MKARQGHVVQIVIGFNYMAPDQCTQFVERNSQLLGRLVLGVLRLDWFDAERSLIHECLHEYYAVNGFSPIGQNSVLWLLASLVCYSSSVLRLDKLKHAGP
jgi:hypothetical protein